MQNFKKHQKYLKQINIINLWQLHVNIQIAFMVLYQISRKAEVFFVMRKTDNPKQYSAKWPVSTSPLQKGGPKYHIP